MTSEKTSSPAAAPSKSASSGESASSLSARWGANAIAGGYTVVPDVLVRSMKELKLARMDLLILMVLATYWRSADDMPWPSKDTIATMLDVDPQTVRRSVKKMEDLGYVKRVFRQSSHRDNLSNKYDMRGLARAVNKLAKEKADLKAKRAAEDKATTATPKAAKLKLVKGSQAEP
jgi:DNA-binding Lrp family transcriptional regulator